ncbi:MAG: uroporphyrinogen-III C-methyltransferase [Steroidobacteraceae bacterium]
MNPMMEAILRGGPKLQPGEVWLVGAGPGDPALLTLEAVRVLAQAEVVVHDALIDPKVLEFAPANAERIFAGKRGGRASPTQRNITEQLIALARAQRRVVRLKGGDPFVFGRGGEEVFDLAAAGVPFRVVAGLTAGLAALTAAGIPATLRGVNQAILLATGHPAPDQPEPDWAAMAKLGQPIVLYMAVRRLAAIRAAIIAGGLQVETPVSVIASATTAEQRVLVSTLAAVAEDAQAAVLDAPAIVLVGEIVSARKALAAMVCKEIHQ